MPALDIPVMGQFGLGKKTETAGTVIVRTVPPKKNAYTVVTTFRYTVQGTAHTITVLRPLGTTTVASTAAAGQADVVLTANPGTGTAAGDPASGDYMVFEKPDGTFLTDTVSAWDTLTVTLGSNLPTGGLAAGAKCWFFGAAADGHPTFDTGTSQVKVYRAADYMKSSGWVASLGKYEPLIVHSGNATAAGTFQQLSGVYSKV